MKRQPYFSAEVAEFLFLLARHRVRYVIVGGEAVIYYGHARLTGEIDLFYAIEPENVKRLYSVFRRTGLISLPFSMDLNSGEPGKRERSNRWFAGEGNFPSIT